MTNNINVTEGTGKTVATEDLGGAQYQKIKVVGGQAGSTSVLGVNPDGSINVSVIGTIRVTGSIIAVGNTSVSGTIGASIIGTVPVTQSGTQITSLVSTVPSSVIVGASIFGQLPAGTAVIGSVAALQGTNPWFTVRPAGSVTAVANLAGSIAAVSATAPAGSVLTIAMVAGSIAAVSATAPAGSVMATNQVAGSIMAVAGTITTVSGNSSVMLLNSTNVIGSVAALQGTNPWTVVHPAASITSVTLPAGSITAVSQSGTWATSVVGGPLNINSILGTYQEETVGGPSIKGIALVWESNANTSVMSTVSPTNPLRISGSVSGRVEATQPAGSLLSAIQVAGSIMAVAGTITTVTGNSSVMLLTSTAVIGSVATLQGTNPWFTVRPAGSVTAVANLAGSIAAVSATAPAGSVLTIATLAGSVMAVSATAPAGSILSVTNPAGSVAAVLATQVTSPWIVAPNNSSLLSLQPAGSIMSITTPAGSVQGVRTDNASVISVLQNSSIVAVPVGSIITVFQSSSLIAINAGSVIAVPSGSVITVLQAPSIVGTYAEDSAHTTADKGVFVLTVRNDAVASTASADLDYTIYAVDSAGRTLVKPFSADESRFVSTGSTVSGSVALLQASAVGKRSYVTDFAITNTGAANALVTFQDGSTSVLGYTIAPATGGSNAVGWAMPMRTAPSQDLAFKVAPSSSVIYWTVTGYQSP